MPPRGHNISAGCFPPGCRSPTISCHPRVARLQDSMSSTLWIFAFDVADVGRVNVGHNGPGQRLDKDLHATTQTQTQVQGAVLLDVVTRHRAAMPELLACETQAMLVWRDALITVDLRFHVADGVGRLLVGHATPGHVLTKTCVKQWEPLYVLLWP